MAHLQSDWLSLLVLGFVLGLKHGLDADHLATIDGLTRYNSRARPAMARYCGVLFSLGHGVVVVAIALGVSTLTGRWAVPAWLGTLGALVSIGFLLALGTMNLRAVWRAAPDCIVQPVGLKGRALGCLWGRLRNCSHPLLVAGVGALFALSFDTLSQAAFFALSASRFGGWPHALALALTFLVGMLLTDGVNGLWIGRLLARADHLALRASRIMCLVVGGVSLLVAAFGIAKLLSPAVERWSDGRELAFGLALVALVALNFLASVRLTRRPALV